MALLLLQLCAELWSRQRAWRGAAAARRDGEVEAAPSQYLRNRERQRMAAEQEAHRAAAAALAEEVCAAPRRAAKHRAVLHPPRTSAPHPAPSPVPGSAPAPHRLRTPHGSRPAPRPAQERTLELLRAEAAACEAAWRAAVSAAKSPRLIAENVADSLRRARSNAGVPCFMRRTSSTRHGVETAAGHPQLEGEEGEEEHRGWRGQELLEDEGADAGTGTGSDEDEDVSFLDSGML